MGADLLVPPNKEDFFHLREFFKASIMYLLVTNSKTWDEIKRLSSKLEKSSRLEQLKNSFSGFGVRIWNVLPQNIRESKSKKLFRKQVHEMFINILKSENSYPSTSSIIDLMKNI